MARGSVRLLLKALGSQVTSMLTVVVGKTLEQCGALFQGAQRDPQCFFQVVTLG